MRIMPALSPANLAQTSRRALFLLLALLASVAPAAAERVLVYDRATSFQRAYQACERQGHTCVHAYAQDFSQRLTEESWDIVLMDLAHNPPNTGWETVLAAYVNAGGRVIHNYIWPSGLAPLEAASGVDVGSALSAPQAVYRWNSHPMFSTPNPVPDVFDHFDDAYTSNGFPLTIVGGSGGVAAAGFTASPTTGQAAIVIGNDGRTIWNGFSYADFESADKDGDAVFDLVELLENQMILALAAPDGSGPVCGNGVVESGEDCDGSACCTAGCSFEAAGASCSDGNACNGVESCNASGSCLPGGFFTCDDNNPCTQDSCDLETGCVHEATIRLDCSAGWAKKKLSINERRAGKERFLLKLTRGPELARSDFGDPSVDLGTAYGVCLFDENDEYVGGLGINRAGERCDRRDCWRGNPRKGYRYKDRAHEADGVQKMVLLPRSEGRSKVIVRGGNNAEKGLTRLPTGWAADLLGSESVTVQLVRDDAPACVSATFDRVVRSSTRQFRAR